VQILANKVVDLFAGANSVIGTLYIIIAPNEPTKDEIVVKIF
jgi:hypothetical protein